MSKFISLPNLLVILVLLTFVSCSTTKSTVYIDELTQKPKKESNNRLEEITNLWVGHFSNKDFVEKSNNEMNVEQEIIGRRIWAENRIGEYWVYLGWFQTNYYESALSSNISQIVRISPDTALIVSYRIKDGIDIGKYEWIKDKPFHNLKRNDIEICGEGCGSYIVKSKDGAYDVITKTPCYSPISDQLKYYTLDAKMNKEGIIFDTKFLDDKFNTLVHYTDNAFLRFNKKELEYKYKDISL